MLELFLVTSTQMIELPTESIVWSGQRYQAARKIEASIFYTDKGSHKYQKVEEGDTLLFKWDKKEMFRGTVFKRGRNKKGMLSLVAYDMLQYLITNRDVYVFSNQRADQIFSRICNDFEIPKGTIVNTGYVFKSLVFANETSLYDMALKAIVETEKQNKRKYQILSKEGKAYLQDWSNPSSLWVLETGVNIDDFTYETSIEETATRVKMVSGNDDQKKTAVVTDDDGKKRYGVLQYFENVSDDLNQAQLTERAKNTLAKKKGISKKLSLSNTLGIADVISGMPVQVSIKDLDINQKYFVNTDSHTFSGNAHTMELELIVNNDAPEVNS